MLSDEQIARYSRQIILPPVGGKGQQKLLSTSTAVIGSGAMATTAALYLAAAGIGAITLAGAEAAQADDLRALNPDCRLSLGTAPVDAVGAEHITREHDVVIDAAADDGVTAMLNLACLAAGKPLVWGSACGSSGWAAVLGRGAESLCFGCLQRQGLRTPDPVPTASALSGVVAAFIGTLQGTEAILRILGLQTAGCGRLLIYDALEAVVRHRAVPNDPDCEMCTPRSGKVARR